MKRVQPNTLVYMWATYTKYTLTLQCDIDTHASQSGETKETEGSMRRAAVATRLEGPD